MLTMLTSLGVFWLCMSAALALIACLCTDERRPRFAARLTLLLLTPAVLAGLALGAHKSGIVSAQFGSWLLMVLLFSLIPGLLLAPSLLYKEGPGDGDDGPGGRGPDEPPPGPQPPPGGLPLAHADPSPARLRDHSRTWNRRRRPRRAPAEPFRQPQHTPREATAKRLSRRLGVA
jgi:hypothetical protein